MADQLKNILHFSLPSGGSQTLPHGLNVQNGLPVVPDHLEADVCGFTFEVDDINVTAFGVGDVNVLVEAWHSIERAFGSVQNTSLIPQPFIPCGGGGGEIPTPPFDQVNIIIYARATGSDMTGDGHTIATAYRTWQRAIRDVPLITAPGAKYYVDCTGLLDGGPEILPADFTMPCWKSPEAYNGDLANPFFLVQTAVNMIAEPRLVASLGADATINPGDIIGITQNPISSQVAIQTNKTFPVPVGTPPVGGLVGKILHGSGGVFENAVIYDNTVDTIFITLDFPPTAPFQIMEQSAELVTTWDQVGLSGGLNALNIDSMAFTGFDIHPGTTGMGERGLFQYGGTVWLEGCNLRAPAFINPARQANMTWTNLDGEFVSNWEAAPYHGSCRLVNLGFPTYGPQASWGTNIYGGTVYDSCGSISAIGIADLFFSDVLIRNAPFGGIYHQSGFLEPFYVGFENITGDAITVAGGEALLTGSMGGTGIGGVALNVSGGANVTIQPDSGNVAFSTPGDSMIVGTLPSRTFADFRVPAAGGFPLQQFDVTGFNATPGTYGASGTGSRVSQNP